MPHIVQYEEIHKCAISRAGKLLGVDDKTSALDNRLVISLLNTLTWRCLLPRKLFGEGINFMWKSIFEGIRRSWLNTFRSNRLMSSTTGLFANVAARAFNQALFPPTAVTPIYPVVSLVNNSHSRRVSKVSLQIFRKINRCERYW